MGRQCSEAKGVALVGHLRRFRKDESGGGLIVFSLFLFVAMLLVVGLAIDVQRSEITRTQVQNTLDRSVLAAAAVNQKLDPEEVVEDYFARAGLTRYLSDVRLAEDVNANGQVLSRTVTAYANAPTPTLFMDMVGVYSLGGPQAATAREGLTNIEISLILDTSSSMKNQQRFPNLKKAVGTFANLMIPPDEPQTASSSSITSISVVPYSMNVNLGAKIAAEYNISDEHAFSNCVLFDDEDFLTTQLLPSQQLDRFAHFTHFNSGSSTVNSVPYIREPLCPRVGATDADEVNPLRPFLTSASEVTDAVDEMQLFGATGIDSGMKWGIAMLDPATRPVITELISKNVVSNIAAGMPLDYSESVSVNEETGSYEVDIASALKVAILMTDGNIDGQRDLTPELRSGLSNVWLDPSSGRFSVLLSGSDRYIPVTGAVEDDASSLGGDASATPEDEEERWYWPHNNSYRDYPYSPYRNDQSRRNDWDEHDENLIRLSNPELFDHFEGPKVWDTLYRRPANNGEITAAEREVYEGWREDQSTDKEAYDRFVELCDVAKAEGIILYTIAFTAPTSPTVVNEFGEDESASKYYLRQCASDEELFFDVTVASQLEGVFAAIANNIAKLKLTF